MAQQNQHSFQKILEQVRDLPSDQRERLMWYLRKESAVHDSGRLDEEIFIPNATPLPPQQDS